ncbi:MAG: alpha-2-macroglobulin family protein [Acidimicrobiales bacterium]
MRRKITLLLLVLALIASACSGDDDAGPDEGPDDSGPTDNGGPAGRANRTAGPVTVSLSQGERSGAAADELVAYVEGAPLDAAAVDRVLDRLPDWSGDDADRVDFNRPAESLRPPVSGDTIDVPFPADGGDPPPAVDDGPLTVLRHQPDGDVGIAPFLSLTFSQPMIALGTVEQTDAADIPVTMTPELAGRWQWIGTRTLRFEHDPEVFDRLPMATTYSVVVPAGTESAAGGALAEDYEFAFATPSATVRSLSPSNDSLELEPVFLASFDQRVDPDAILGVTTMTLEGREVAIRLASDNEIAGDEFVSERIEQAVEGTWVAFRAVEAFTPDSAIRIEIGPEIPSVEGPDTTDEVFTEQARTYAPLRVDDQSCRPGDDCQPDWGFSVSFNNELDPDSLDPEDLRFEPALPGAYVRIQGNWIEINGPIVGGTVYEMTVPAALTDVFGQTLGDDEVIEFTVDDAYPFLDFDRGRLATLDPLVDSQTLPLQLRNHSEVRVRAFAVDPSDWADYVDYWDDRWDDDGFPDPPWTEIYDAVQQTGAPANERFEARIDLEPVFGGEPGMAVVVVEAVGELANLDRDNDRRYWDNQPVVQWVQSTALGADLIADQETGYAWVTDLTTGAPVAGASVAPAPIWATTDPVVTGADGLATLPLPGSREDSGPLVVSLGDDMAISEAYASASPATDQALWYVVDDRGLYRPGETISVKGWVRLLDLSDDATIEEFPEGEAFTYSVKDAFGNEIAAGDVALSATGGFDFTADIPLGANLGQGWIEFGHPSTPQRFGHTHNFGIEEFRRPEFEVTARAETPGPYLVDDPATVAVDATYFSGGPLPDAPVDWWVVTRPTSYSPPGWGEFTFGAWIPWWDRSPFGEYAYDDVCCGGPGFEPESSAESFSGTTDSTGSHFLRMDFAGDGEGRPTTVSATASVTDVNRQTWSSTTDLLVHAAALYVGIHATRPFVKAGDPLPVEVIVTDIDGVAVPDRVADVVAEQVRSEYVDGEWTEVVIDSEPCEITSTDAPEICTFAMENGGRYRIAASVVDDAGRESRSEMTVWVSGGESLPSRRLELQEATVVPDQDAYAAGDTAEIFVGSPFGAAHGLMTISRNGIEEIVPFEIEGSDTILEIDIRDEHVPSLRIGIELVGITDRAADDGTVLPDVPPRPAYATGGVDLRVPPASRTLAVEAIPADDVVEPGASTSVTVEVTDAAGDPVEGAELLVVAVDEAVLALTGYELLDPLDIFYRSLGDRDSVSRSRDSILLADPQALVDLARQLEETVQTSLASPLPQDGATDELGDDTADSDMSEAARAPAALITAYAVGGDAAPIEVRSNFDALALWDPEVTTGADGRATVDFDLPDSLTRYRVMVVAVDGVDRFGSAESNLTAQLPLQVRPSAPRFLNFGDDFELPVVLQNLTDEAMEVEVVLQTANLEMTGPAGQSVTVPANNRVEVRFPVTTESAGTARFRAAAVSGDHADAATISLPVYTPATAEAFATYGVVDSGSTGNGATIQPVLAPEGVIPQFGGLEVTTSSTAVQALTDAVLYLAEYDYTSADAYASRILAIAALRDVLEAFEAEGIPTPTEFDQIVADDIASLAALQNYDGGWSTWRRNFETSPYRSVHVMHALYEAKANGYAVPAGVLEQGRSFLQNVEGYIPQDWSAESRDTLIAYSLFVRRLDGDLDPNRADEIWRRHGLDFGLDALAWLWPVIGDEAIATEIRRNFSNRVTETPSAATFTTDYTEDAYLLLQSDRRTDGIVLGAMLLMDPDNDLIPKIVTGLIGNQRQGRWNNSQENAFILLALNNYFDTFEATTPDFVARVWLGDLYAAEHVFEGRSVDSQETVVPMQDLLDQGDTDLVVSNDGVGRLYYRLGLRYAPDDFDLDPLDRGFVVQRSYEGVDDEGDVWLDDDGVWHVKAGAEVRVKLTMVNDSQRTNMALIDPLPAGLEPSNPALAVTADLGDRGDRDVEAAADSWWYWTWYDHQNLRDDRAEAFSAYLWAGTHEYSYLARATTPGTFVVPPTRAEEIYAPEVFGRSASDRLIIE